MPPKSTLHDTIREQLISEVQDLPLQEQLPSDRQLAKRFGVALLTINRVMKSLQADGYVDRIQGKGTILASREKRVKRDGHNGEPTVLVATPHYFSHQYWERNFVAEELALKGGNRMLEFRFAGTAGFDGLLKLAREQDALSGILIDPVPGSIKRPIVEELDALGVPVFIFFPCEWVGLTENVYSIVPDWAKSGYLATQSLLKSGYTKLAYLNNEPAHFDDGQLKNGVKQALYDNGLRLKDLVRIPPACKAWHSSREAGYRMAQDALKQDVDGLILASVNGAFSSYRAILEAGRRISHDIGIVACNGDDGMSEYMAPPLTTVAASTRAELQIAFDVMYDGLEPPSRQILSDTVLTERASSTRLDDAQN